MPKHKLISYMSGLVITLSLVVITVISAVQTRQPVSTSSRAQTLTETDTTKSTGLIAPTKTPVQITIDNNLTRLYSSLPVSQPTFKITFDYWRDKYLVTYIGSTTLAQTNFKNWLTANNFSSLYPAYFTFISSSPTPTRNPTSVPTRTPTPGICSGKIPICVDCVQCKSGVWTCVPCNSAL